MMKSSAIWDTPDARFAYFFTNTFDACSFRLTVDWTEFILDYTVIKPSTFVK